MLYKVVKVQRVVRIEMVYTVLLLSMSCMLQLVHRSTGETQDNIDIFGCSKVMSEIFQNEFEFPVLLHIISIKRTMVIHLLYFEHFV